MTNDVLRALAAAPEWRGPLQALGWLLLTVMALPLVRRALAGAAGNAERHTGLPIEPDGLRKATTSTSLVVLAVGGRIALGSLSQHGQLARVADTGLFLLAVLFGLVAAARVYQLFLSWYGLKAAADGSPAIQHELLPLARSVGFVALSLVALSLAMAHFGQTVSSVLVSLGVGSLALGLAAQDTLANMIAGFVILIDRPFLVGDRLRLDGQEGDVVRIGLRSTTLHLADGTTLVAPNGDLTKSRLCVLSRGGGPPLVRLVLPITHASDPAKAKALAIASAVAARHVLADPAPRAQLASSGTAALELAVLAWIDDVRHKGDVVDDIHTGILSRLPGSGVALASAVAELRFSGPAPVTSAPS